MAGLDSSFSAAIFIGYHASTTNPKGVRAHTFSSAHYARVTLNGNAVTEGEYNAAYAGAKGVPVIFASGDDAAVEEIKSRLGNIETVETKKALSFHSAETLTPAASCDKIYAGVKAALRPAARFQTLRDQDAGDAGNYVQELHAGGGAELPASRAASGFAYDPVRGQRHG